MSKIIYAKYTIQLMGEVYDDGEFYVAPFDEFSEDDGVNEETPNFSRKMWSIYGVDKEGLSEWLIDFNFENKVAADRLFEHLKETLELSRVLIKIAEVMKSR